MNASREGALLLEAAQELARRMGAVALKRYRRDLAVETKRDGSPVTAADREAEQAARDWLASRFPDDGVLGEELGALRPDAKRRWVVDPIDGTKSFVRGVPLWGSMVAVAEGERVLCGAVAFPGVSEIIAAAPGHGCWHDGARAHVSDVGELRRATALTTDTTFSAAPGRREPWERLTSQCAVSRSWGDCYGYLLVATGRAEIMIDPVLSPWDSAALQPIITEAGGVFTDWSGQPSGFGGSAVATNAALADQVRGTLRQDQLPSRPPQS